MLSQTGVLELNWLLLLFLLLFLSHLLCKFASLSESSLTHVDVVLTSILIIVLHLVNLITIHVLHIAHVESLVLVVVVGGCVLHHAVNASISGMASLFLVQIISYLILNMALLLIKV